MPKRPEPMRGGANGLPSIDASTRVTAYRADVHALLSATRPLPLHDEDARTYMQDDGRRVVAQAQAQASNVLYCRLQFYPIPLSVDWHPLKGREATQVTDLLPQGTPLASFKPLLRNCLAEMALRELGLPAGLPVWAMFDPTSAAEWKQLAFPGARTLLLPQREGQAQRGLIYHLTLAAALADMVP